MKRGIIGSITAIDRARDLKTVKIKSLSEVRTYDTIQKNGVKSYFARLTNWRGTQFESTITDGEFGTRGAHPDPDDRPRFNEWQACLGVMRLIDRFD